MADIDSAPAAQPTLTDGTVTLRPWNVADLASVTEPDEQITFWLGQDAAVLSPSTIAGWHSAWVQGQVAAFVVTVGDEVVGRAEVERCDTHVAQMRWATFAKHRRMGYATQAVRTLADWALTPRAEGGFGVERIEARVEPSNPGGLRIATRSGLRREGIERLSPSSGVRAESSEYVVHARLSSDPPLSEPESFRALLNSFLPRKRAIAQMLVLDPEDRVLLCQLTYKRDWDLPGGVIEPGESPRIGVNREVSEELSLELSAESLLVTDWLPPWSGWEDALCLVFSGGVHPSSLLDGVQKQPGEIKSVEWCTPEQVTERCADFTARRIDAALQAVQQPQLRGQFTESGRPVIG